VRDHLRRTASRAAPRHLDELRTPRRQARLQQLEAAFEPVPFDAIAARSYGQVVAAVMGKGRSHRRRIADLLIAATAHANGLALYTRNPDDFAGLSDLIDVVGI
jgi:hypothetical protein